MNCHYLPYGGTLILINDRFDGMETKVLIHFYVFESIILYKFRKAVPSNHLHVQGFDSLRSLLWNHKLSNNTFSK